MPHHGTIHDSLYNAFSFGLFAAYELESEGRELLHAPADRSQRLGCTAASGRAAPVNQKSQASSQRGFSYSSIQVESFDHNLPQLLHGMVRPILVIQRNLTQSFCQDLAS